MENILEQALNAEKIIIYGAHLVAKEAYQCLKKRKPDINVLSFVVTDTKDNPSVLEGLSVKAVSEISEDKEELYVLVAMPEKYHREVADNLSGLGFNNTGFIGLRDISVLKGLDMVSMPQQRSSRYCLAESKNDYSWLDIFMRDSNGEAIKDRHYKFTILTRIPEENIFERLEKFDFLADYEKILGEYRSLPRVGSLNETDTKADGNYMDIYMVMCHKDQKLKTSYKPLKYVQPLQAGAALTDIRKTELVDCEGENISEKNVSLAEMTAMYWIWKNSRRAKYKGLCHYRRHFDMSDAQARALEENQIDAVLTTPRLVLNGIKNMFLSDTPVKEDVFDNMMSSIKTAAGNDWFDYAMQYFDSVLYYPNNMLIAKEKVFNDYCEWIFPIMFQMEQNDIRNHVVKNDRHIAFAAELLTSLYFSFNKNNYKIAVTDYCFLE